MFIELTIVKKTCNAILAKNYYSADWICKCSVIDNWDEVPAYGTHYIDVKRSILLDRKFISRIKRQNGGKKNEFRLRERNRA